MSTVTSAAARDSEFTIAELRIPAAIGAVGWAEFAETAEIRNEIIAQLTGHHELDLPPAEALPRWQDQNEPKRMWTATLDGRIVGRAGYVFDNDGTAAWINVAVLARYRGAGIGNALWTTVHGVAVSEGKTIFQTEIFARADESGEQILSPSGFGSVSADEPGVRFALRLGFGLELVTRLSHLVLPAGESELRNLLRSAKTAAGPDYRLVRWIGPTPERWLADVAVVRGRIMTDAPHGDIVVIEDEWTEQRVREFDAIESEGGRTMLVSAIEHVPSGHLVAYNDLEVPPELDRTVSQGMTLVLAEHRGHRLGMLMKVDNIQQLAETFPGHPAIETMNAEENAPMLAVNEAVGFVGTSKFSAWKLDAGRAATPSSDGG